MRNRGEDSPFNHMPRYCGAFYWQQAINVINAGAKQIFVAMFDEVDEGTAMYKMIEKPEGLPKNSDLIPLNIDGCDLRNDFYLRLSQATTKLLRSGVKGERTLPIQLRSGETIGSLDFTRGLPS
jgi:hypothetical protein